MIVVEFEEQEYVKEEVVVFCPAVENVTNGQMNSEYADHFDGSVIIFQCFDGYHLIGTSQTTCENGKWSNSIPECIEDSSNGVLVGILVASILLVLIAIFVVVALVIRRRKSAGIS